MCGIHGLLNLDGSPADPSLMGVMGAVTRHRGPDDEGSHADGPCLIGMRRLSIIDLSGGHQPISNQSESLWIVCNGEIYNFRELRDELISNGHVFKTRSDTEVALHAYAQWGDQFLERLNGMFALAIWDATRKRLIVARDRLGIKPLYWHSDGKRFAFSTEAKAILTLPGFSVDINRSALQSYLHYGYVMSPSSIFDKISKLPPASLLIVQDGKINQKCYWRLPTKIDDTISEGEWIERVRARLQRSVQMQMISDVPLGAFLSGGIDSSAVVGYMARYSDQPVKTYSIGFEGGAADAFYNELPYAKRVAQLYGTDHHEIVVKPDVIGLLPKLLWHMDEPIADSAFLTTFLVSEFARRDVTVILSGVGGDELFGGYRRYLGNYYTARFGRLPAWVQSLARKTGALLPADRHSGLLNMTRLAKGFLASSALSFGQRYQSYMQIIRPEVCALLLREGIHPSADPFDVALANLDGDDSLNNMLAVDAQTQLPDDLLLLTDKMSMATSLECRVPLLDHELVELAAAIPESLKVRGGTLKYVLKKALGDLLPADILHRKKRGFGTPVGAWLKGELSTQLHSILSEGTISKRGLFNPTAVHGLIKAHERNDEDYTDILMALMNLEIWSRIYLDGRDFRDVALELKEGIA